MRQRLSAKFWLPHLGCTFYFANGIFPYRLLKCLLRKVSIEKKKERKKCFLKIPKVGRSLSSSNITRSLTGYWCKVHCYRVWHGFRLLRKWNDYFQVSFDHFESVFFEAAGRVLKMGFSLKPNCRNQIKLVYGKSVKRSKYSSVFCEQIL